MAVELPYFKYYPGEWIKGDITLCSMTAQGLFINLCAYYWAKNCSMSLANAKQRFKMEEELNELLENNIIQDIDGELQILFLDKQFSQFTEISEKRTEAGRKGGRMKRTKQPEKSKCQANAKQMLSYKEKIREEKIREDKKNLIKKVSSNGKEINFYFNTPKFKHYWNEWKEYKRIEFNYKYKSPRAEQSSITELYNLSGKDQKTAIAIIEQSFAKGWRGFFPLQNEKENKKNGQSTQSNRAYTGTFEPKKGIKIE
jgi:hypothetical protein